MVLSENSYTIIYPPLLPGAGLTRGGILLGTVLLGQFQQPLADEIGVGDVLAAVDLDAAVAFDVRQAFAQDLERLLLFVPGEQQYAGQAGLLGKLFAQRLDHG